MIERSLTDGVFLLVIIFCSCITGYSQANIEHSNIERAVSLESGSLDSRRILGLWEDFAAEDSEKACEAVAVLVAAGSEGVQLLERFVESALAYVDQSQIKRLIWDMTHDESGTGQQDLEELAKLGRLAEKALIDALEKATSEEARSRIEASLDACSKSFSVSPEARRVTRIMWALELIGTEEAQELRNRLGIPIRPRTWWRAGSTARIRPLAGKDRTAARQARNKGDQLRADYGSRHRPGPPKEIKAFAKTVVAYKEAIESFPQTDIDAYCRLRLSGFYQYTGNHGKKMHELAEMARLFAGTNHETDTYLELGYTYLQGCHNPAKAIPWFEKVLSLTNRPVPKSATRAEELNLAAERNKFSVSAQQGLERCRKELAARMEADKTPWATAVEGVQCRLRPDKLVFGAGRFPGFRADVQNAGSRHLWLPDGGNVPEVKVDGQWYARPKRQPDRLHWLGPDCQHYSEGVVLGKYWQNKDDDSTLSLAAGKHTVQIAFTAEPHGIYSGQPVRVVSNSVDIEILPE